MNKLLRRKLITTGLVATAGTSGLAVVAKLAEGIVKLRRSAQTGWMRTDVPSYRGYRLPPDLINHAVWLYHRFCLSFQDVGDRLSERWVIVSYETIRQ